MAARSTGSSTINFGLVAIPVKFYTAQKEAGAAFRQITPDGNRVKQRWVDEISGEEVPFAELRKGYEIAKDNFVIFDKDEIKAMAPPSSQSMEILEMVEVESVSALSVKDVSYMGPGKGGEKAYGLLAAVLKSKGKVAVARRYNSRSSKEDLVTIREFQGGLLLQRMYYAPEVRDFDAKGSVETQFHEKEVAMAEMLVEQLSTGSYDPSKYEDEYAKTVKAAAEAKAEGKEVEIVNTSPQAAIVDLAAALAASLGDDKVAATG